MLRWKLSERTSYACLFAAGCLTTTLSASELPGRAQLTPLEQVQQESAQQRWERLKSRYQPVLVPESVEATTALPASRAPDAAILPIPDDADWTAARAAAAMPLPYGSEEPAWIVAAPHVPKTDVAEQRMVDSAARQAHTAAPATQTQERVSWQPTPQLHSVATASAQTAPTPALPPMPAAVDGQPARRPVRPMGEIKPYYDTTVDEDIREFAEERAAEYNVHFGSEEYQPRMFADTAATWQPTNFYHFPLYFEDPALERYGHTYPFVVQPFVSVARFSGQLVAMPYQMTLDPPTKPMYALGWYRPGEVAPKLKYQIPWNAEAAAVQAGVTTGLIFLIP